MTKAAFIILIGIVLFSCVGCGGSGNSSVLSGMTPVTIEISGSQAVARDGRTSAAKGIPSDVVLVRITVSAPDMMTIETGVQLSGDPVSAIIQVPNGLNRHFVVEALNSGDVVFYRGESFADLDGSPATLAIPMIATGKNTPPDFSGLEAVKPLSAASLLLTWTAGSDIVTPSDRIQYLVYMATAPGTEDMTAPSYTVPGGAMPVSGMLSFVVNALKPGTTYYFRVRAMDEQGNVDSNIIEKSGTTLPVVTPDPTPTPTPTPTPQDTVAPSFAGIVSAVASSESVIRISWNPAADQVTPAPEIRYKVYMASQSGGEDFSNAVLTTPSGETNVLVENLTAGATYYFVVRAMDKAGNSDTNTVERSATTKFVDLMPLTGYTPVMNGMLSFGVQNNGTTYAYDVETWVLYGSRNSNTFCEPFTVSKIAPYQTVGFTVYGIYYPDYLVIVDPQGRILETDKNNNKACSGVYCTNPPPLPASCIFIGF